MKTTPFTASYLWPALMHALCVVFLMFLPPISTQGGPPKCVDDHASVTWGEQVRIVRALYIIHHDNASH